MSTAKHVSSNKLKSDAISALTTAFIAFIGLIILIEHFKEQYISSKQVKIFAIMSVFCLLIMVLIDGILLNNSIFSDLHSKYDILSKCFPIYAVEAIFYFAARYFMMAFSLSRLRYFFNSTDLELNKTFYHAVLSFNLLVTSTMCIYFVFTMEIIIIKATEDNDMKRCSADDYTIFILYCFFIEGLMQCLILFVYYRTYKKFLTVYDTQNIDDKYMKKRVVKRSLILGISSIMSIWLFGICAMVPINEFINYLSAILSIIIQVCAIVFSFDIKCCCSCHIQNGDGDIDVYDSDMSIEMGLTSNLSPQNEEYLKCIMEAYYTTPTRRANDI